MIVYKREAETKSNKFCVGTWEACVSPGHAIVVSTKLSFFHLRYRILAFDHDLFSFVDLTFEEWPAVLITNPKSSLYSSSFHEPLVKILYSTHIRYPIIIS